MLKKRIIPCLDVKDGRVVKGINFLDLVDAGDPVKQAKFYSENGADEICFLDISASLENRDTILKMVERTAEKVFIPLTVGGGVRSIENIPNLLKAGADKVSINSAAIKNPDIIKRSSKYFGSQCIVVAVDVKKDNTSPSSDESTGRWSPHMMVYGPQAIAFHTATNDIDWWEKSMVSEDDDELKINGAKNEHDNHHGVPLNICLSDSKETGHNMGPTLVDTSVQVEWGESEDNKKWYKGKECYT